MVPELTRRQILTLGTAFSLPGVGCGGGQRPTAITVEDGFEDGLDARDRSADVLDHPDTGEPLEWSIAVTTDRARRRVERSVRPRR